MKIFDLNGDSIDKLRMKIYVLFCNIKSMTSK